MLGTACMYGMLPSVCHVGSKRYHSNDLVADLFSAAQSMLTYISVTEFDDRTKTMPGKQMHNGSTSGPHGFPSHHATAAVVVQVHERPRVLHHPLPGVHKVLGELDAVVDVIAAAAPVKVPLLVAGSAPLLAVTAADLQLALAAGLGDGVHHACRRDGVHKRRLPAACVDAQREREHSCEV